MVRVSPRVVFGTLAAVGLALLASAVSRAGQHLLRGAARRDGPEPVQPEGPQDRRLPEGLGRASGGDAVQPLQLQLLLAGPHAAGAWVRGAVAGANARDGRRADRSRVAAIRVVGLPRRATKVGHHPRSGPQSFWTDLLCSCTFRNFMRRMLTNMPHEPGQVRRSSYSRIPTLASMASGPGASARTRIIRFPDVNCRRVGTRTGRRS